MDYSRFYCSPRVIHGDTSAMTKKAKEYTDNITKTALEKYQKVDTLTQEHIGCLIVKVRPTAGSGHSDTSYMKEMYNLLHIEKRACDHSCRLDQDASGESVHMKIANLHDVIEIHGIFSEGWALANHYSIAQQLNVTGCLNCYEKKSRVLCEVCWLIGYCSNECRKKASERHKSICRKGKISLIDNE